MSALVLFCSPAAIRVITIARVLEMVEAGENGAARVMKHFLGKRCR